MKSVILDGYLVGNGGCSWTPISQYGELFYYDDTTAADDIAARIGDADAAAACDADAARALAAYLAECGVRP